MPTTFEDDPSNKRKNETKIKEKRMKMVDPAVEALKNMQEAVCSNLINCEPGKELETVLQTLQHNVRGQQVKEDVLAAFRHYYAGMFKDDHLHLFGSTVMGIAFQDSDLDFYVELPSCEQFRSKKGQIKQIRRILESTEKFARFESIKRPRVPIIKCTHIDTLTNCDFNCSNQFGSLNSPIIAHLLNFDPRIHTLAIIAKYWMKIHDCSGIDRISNYAVVWMLIFYLQTLPKRIVPPIDEFQRNVPPSMVSHCNFAFDYSLPNRTDNQSSWTELLLGFFKFYSHFDYDSLLICPLYGKTFSKADVKAKKIPELQRYEQILLADSNEKPMRLDTRTLLIQDPFDILRQMPGDISIRHFQKIVWKIGFAAETIECELEKGDTKSLFSKIFDVAKFDQYAQRKEEQENVKRHAEAQQRKMGQRLAEEKRAEENNYLPISITSIRLDDAENGKVTLQLKPTNFILNISSGYGDVWKNLTSTVPIDEHSIRKMWAKEVIQMIVDVLRDIFRLNVYDQGSDEFVKDIDLIGARNLFNRRNRRSISTKTWHQETLDSLNRFNRSAKFVPLEISAKVTADIVNFDYISIEFNDAIKTEENNFYKKFRINFIKSIDYLLNIYFIHRKEMAKSSTVNANPTKLNLAKMKPGTESAKQQEMAKSNIAAANQPKVKLQKPKPTLPITHIAPQQSQNPLTTIKLEPTEFTLSIVKDILLKSEKYSKEDAESEKQSIRQSWAQEVIKMIADILTGIFKLEIHNETFNTYLRMFYITGSFDNSNRIFLRRKQKKSVSTDTWITELLDSSNRFNSKSSCDVPLKLSAKIYADEENFSYVFVEFSDQINSRKQNFYRTFCQEFTNRIDYLLRIYFVHRNGETKSVTVNANPAQMKPVTEAETQQKSTSNKPNHTTHSS